MTQAIHFKGKNDHIGHIIKTVRKFHSFALSDPDKCAYKGHLLILQ